MSKIKFISSWKDNTRLEDYPAKIQDHQLRKIITKFRMRDHDLQIKKGRHLGIKREERFCPICPTTSMEDEDHFLVDCSLYSPFRQVIFSKIKKDYLKSQENLKTIIIDLFRSNDVH